MRVTMFMLGALLLCGCSSQVASNATPQAPSSTGKPLESSKWFVNISNDTGLGDVVLEVSGNVVVDGACLRVKPDYALIRKGDTTTFELEEPDGCTQGAIIHIRVTKSEERIESGGFFFMQHFFPPVLALVNGQKFPNHICIRPEKYYDAPVRFYPFATEEIHVLYPKSDGTCPK